MSEPAIVAIIPAYNAEATIAACLDGAASAGFRPQDVILVDDGSTDRTPDIARGRGVCVIRRAGTRGAGAARNAGVAVAEAKLVLFVDADVALHPGTRALILDFFRDHPGHAGVIGSYDGAPPAPGAVSRIRNLLHHHVHQRSGGNVGSFWTGCGAIRRADFLAAGGFEHGHKLEDVALGIALAHLGRPIRLEPAILCTHLKRWTLRSMIRADLLYRALPWSRMLLDPGNSGLRAELNAGARGKVSVILAGLAAAATMAIPFAAPVAAPTMVAALTIMAALDAAFLRLVARRLGTLRALQAVGVLWIHYLCAGAGFGWAVLERITPLGRRGAFPPRGA